MHASGSHGQPRKGQKPSWEEGGWKSEFPHEMPYKCNTCRKGVMPSFAASAVWALQKFGDFVPEENLEVSSLSTLPSESFLEVLSHPVIPVPSHPPVIRPPVTQTEIHKRFPLETPRSSPARNTEGGDRADRCVQICCPPGVGSLAPSVEARVQGNFRVMIRAESATLPESLSLCLPHRPIRGTEMSSRALRKA